MSIEGRMLQNIYEGFFFIEGARSTKIDGSTSFNEDIDPIIGDNYSTTLSDIYGRMGDPTDIKFTGTTIQGQDYAFDVLKMHFIVDNDIPVGQRARHDPHDMTGKSLHPSAIITRKLETDGLQLDKYFITVPNKNIGNPPEKLYLTSIPKINDIKTWRMIFEVLGMLYTVLEGIKNNEFSDSIKDLFDLWFRKQLSSVPKEQAQNFPQSFEYCTQNISEQLKEKLINFFFKNYPTAITGAGKTEYIGGDGYELRECPFWTGKSESGETSYYVESSCKMHDIGIRFAPNRGVVRIGFKVKTHGFYDGHDGKRIITIGAIVDPAFFENNYKSTNSDLEVFYVLRKPEITYKYHDGSKRYGHIRNANIKPVLGLYENDYGLSTGDEYERLFAKVGRGTFKYIRKIEVGINGNVDNDKQKFYLLSKTRPFDPNDDVLLADPNIISALKAAIIVNERDHWNESYYSDGQGSSLVPRFIKVDTDVGSISDITPEIVDKSKNVILNDMALYKGLLSYRYPTLFTQAVRHIVFLGKLCRPLILSDIPNSVYSTVQDISPISYDVIQNIAKGTAPGCAEIAYKPDDVDGIKYYEFSTIAKYFPAFVVAGVDGALTDAIPAFKPDMENYIQGQSQTSLSQSDVANARQFYMRLDMIYNHAQGKNLLTENNAKSHGIDFTESNSGIVTFNLVGYKWKVNCENICMSLSKPVN